ncbi:MAG: 16S rRNA (cytosine(1402)-N(4))-methyltransferase RsmH [Mogibacterium sp.]|nr:16S rRNA (cytosine(1402)-N(4))-methyltransferase RsmH [Mogibacterium sp.]
MDFSHTPVLYREALEALAVRPGGTYVDGTVGGAGHASGIAERLGGSDLLVCVDRDERALAAAEERLAPYECSKVFLHANYSEADRIERAAGGKVDGILLDLGVSSHQLDTVERGFSYMQDAPIDMRMDESEPTTAYDVVNRYSEADLAGIIRMYGEEKWASRIAKFIVEARRNHPITRTGELVDIIKAAIPAKARREGPHPAKRTFQAIRIEVNRELEHLELAMERLPDILAPGGRIAVITFHSLEDRIVKEAFAKRLNPCTCPKEFPVCVCGKVADVRKVTGKPVIPSQEEIEQNPRARSAKLRVIEKLGQQDRDR